MRELKRLDGIHGFAAFSPDWQLVAGRSGDTGSSGASRVVSLRDVENGREQVRLEGHTDSVRGGVFAPDGRVFVSAGGRDKTVRVWDVQQGHEVQQLTGHTSTVAVVAVSPDGQLIASASVPETDWGERTVRVWDMQQGHELACFEQPTDTTTLIFSPDSRRLAVAGKTAEVEVWEIASGTEVQRINRQGQGSLAMSPDWHVLASVGLDDPSLFLWDVESGQQIQRFERARDFHSGVAFCDDGRLLASGGKYLQVWDMQQGAEVRRLMLERLELLIGFHPEGQSIALLNPEGVVRLLEVGSEAELEQAAQELAQTVAQQKERHAAGLCIGCGGRLSWKDRMFRHVTCQACRAHE